MNPCGGSDGEMSTYLSANDYFSNEEPQAPDVRKLCFPSPAIAHLSEACRSTLPAKLREATVGRRVRPRLVSLRSSNTASASLSLGRQLTLFKKCR